VPRQGRRNDLDEQIAALDSQLRWTLSRFCWIAWFGTLLCLPCP